jgi:hypothetical protein
VIRRRHGSSGWRRLGPAEAVAEEEEEEAIA